MRTRQRLGDCVDTQQPDLVVLGVSVNGVEVGEILEVLVRKSFTGQVLVIGQPDTIMVKAVRQIGDEYGIAMLPSLPTPFSAGTLRASLAALLPSEPAPSPAVDVAEALKAGWLELWYQQKIDARTLVSQRRRGAGADAASRLGRGAAGLFLRDDKDPHYRACPNS